ncbi:E3 ubiquitin-protein ligase TRIM39-like [Acipenser ruthenus]|uniref:E3 ubiquitin-protein ligase TRIM39-like n=1 Tax=Acipenser ruthenus TaxID=7906 RepID=UPI0027411A5E|nr:E3 ubiquitin-protein ligase TRIM39-like [Acipenser ruthenus]
MRLGKEASFKVGCCFAVVVLILLVAGIFCFACYTEKEDLQKQNESLKNEKERLGKDCEELQQDRNILKSENERLGKEKEVLLEQNEILKKENETLGKDCEELQQDRNILKSEKERLGKVNECLLDQNETLKQEKEKVEAEKEDLQKKNDSLKGKNERLGKEKEDLQKQNETLKQEKEKVETDFKELRRNTNTCVYAVDRDWKKLIEACVNVTLDPNTASPLLTVSEDGSRVRFTGERSAEWPSVLGREGFTSGRRYWEVEVGEKGYWVLGVSTHPHEKSIPEKPGEGYWLVRLDKWKTCKAVSQSVDQTLNLEKICKVWGVYLDHGGGRLSFYNAETRFHIHTLEGSFPGQVYPIFSPGSHDKGPLIIKAKVKNV